jgi:DNA-binding LytR/AlgR family response regulator
MPTAIIADDEDLARDDLRRMLTVAWPELNIVAQCEDGTDTLEAIANLQPDVAFLDIRMPGMTGLDVAQATSGKCQIVFTTAYDNHAISAFDLGALDYLLKPLTQERLSQAVARLRSRMDAHIGAPELMRMMSELDKRLSQSRQTERMRWISASVGDTIHLFPIDEVLFFESDLKYTRVVTATEEAHVRLSLRELQQGLDLEQFWQIHRGTIVRTSAIARARRDDLGGITVELRDHEERLKVSRAYAWRFKGM